MCFHIDPQFSEIFRTSAPANVSRQRFWFFHPTISPRRMGKWTSAFTRGKITAFRQSGRTIRWIAKALKKPPATVADIARKGDTTADKTADQKHIGRAKALSDRDKRRIVAAIREDSGITYGEVKANLGLTCSPRTICGAAIDAGYRTLRPPSKTKLSPANIADRIAYCRKYKDKPRSFWRNSIHFYVDGTRFRKMRDLKAARRGLGNRRKRLKGEGLANANLPDPPLQVATHNVPFFVGMNGRGKITLAEPYAPPLKMDAAKWGPIRAKIPAAMRAAHPYIAPQRWLLSQDNDHAQNTSPQWWTEQGRNIGMHKGPANSGDLRGIESAWPPINKDVAATDPGPESRAEFITRVRGLLLDFDPAKLEPKLTNIPNRLRKCLAKKGGRVPY